MTGITANQGVGDASRRGKQHTALALIGQARRRAHFCQPTDFSRETVNPSFCLKSSEFQLLGQYELAKENLPTPGSASFIFYLLQRPLPFLLTMCQLHTESQL